ncbi:MAG: hypothetical protein ACRBBK_02775 [Paracoccaceae bacterium]
MRRAVSILMVAGLALGACVPKDKESQELDTGLAGYNPKLFETQKADCIARGGQFGRGGLSGGYVCFETPRDAGKSCSKASDCESACLARSRTCSPIKPVFGCVDVLTQSGRPSTLCID